jgi:membrane protein implicated in regulation of membrane protease activity
MVGELAVALDPIAPGGQGRAELRGTTWTARNLASTPLAAGQSIRVERIDGLTIHVRPEES